MKKHHLTQVLIGAAIALGPLAPLSAQGPSTSGSDTVAVSKTSWLDAQITADPAGIMELEIVTDLRQLMRGKMAEEYQPAELSYREADGSTKTWQIELRARGKTRKQMCQHPPIKIKLKKKDVLAAGFGPYNEMKVVWQCQSAENYAQILFREYMIYHLYNQLTDCAFHTKLARINLIDAADTSRKFVKLAFFIEDEQQLADRVGGVVLEEAPKDFRSLHRQQLMTFAIFEYMIGNTDWSFGNLHNSRFIKLNPPATRIMPVPYDFDYSGLVNAPYSVPHESLPIKSVRERLYRGSAATETELSLLRQKFLEAKPKMLAFIEAFPHLEKGHRNDFLRYLGEFFELLEDEKRFVRAMTP